MSFTLALIGGISLLLIGFIFGRFFASTSKGFIPPNNPIPNDSTSLNESDLNKLQYYMKEWEVVINTQMHFNDLIPINS